MLLRGSRRGLLNLGSLLMAVVFCDVVSRRAVRAPNTTASCFFPPGVLESSAASCMRCYPSRGLAGLALRADARSSACELRFDATPINA